jgi:quercetin dioxygenase-like cupin family protein
VGAGRTASARRVFRAYFAEGIDMTSPAIVARALASGRELLAATLKPMPKTRFPARIRALPEFQGPFEASRLRAEACEVLFASYPAGTAIAPHSHETENCGVITRGELILTVGGSESRFGPGEWYQLDPGQEHAARFEVDTAEIEFWFDARASRP